jgi:hypothetical protein
MNDQRCLCSAITMVVLFLLPAFVFAQRLPDTVRPDHYEIWLNPDLNTGALQGKEIISIELSVPMQSIYVFSFPGGLRFG